ncbi:two-component system sensor histidine kinase NtrB [Tundrisphaera sp. TA3]|uniref:two-component system sensor histidine kinase NtrB n=1 Tax=Tundrisphaera sp. TA3 TaxID=3435775 RepID=UPI003EB9E41B
MRVPIRIQVGVVVALFVAALAALLTTSTAVVGRERRRATAGTVLARAGVGLADQGKDLLRDVPRGFFELDREEWDELDRRLREVSAHALRPFEGVEGGYFLRDHRRFLGAAFPTEPPHPPGKRRHNRRGPDGPPPRESDLIEIQADASIRLGRELLVVEDVPPSIVAIRTAPVRIDGRPVAATWTMTRLADPLFLDRSFRGFQLAAGLALGGLALALLMTLGLTRTVRRQAADRARLQVELRRSERLAALGKLLAGVAHEVRNPLAGIRSSAQLWRRGIGPDDESIDDVLAEVDRLDGIVGRLLQFTRADSQDLAPGDLNAVVVEAARLARAPAEAQGVRVELDLDPGLPPVAMAWPALIQVFRNLTTNAIHAMPEGGVLRLSTSRDAKGARVEACVADTGPGLDADAMAHLFEPFYTTRAEGTGLGLAIAREIALAHRGDLRGANRGDGAGAAFTIILPAATDGESPR